MESRIVEESKEPEYPALMAYSDGGVILVSSKKGRFFTGVGIVAGPGVEVAEWSDDWTEDDISRFHGTIELKN